MIAHIWQPPMYGAPDFPISGDVIQSLADDAARILVDWESSAKAAGVKTQSKTITGVPWNEIVRLAEEAHTDLIVMATHGRTGLGHALIGSVAEKVVRHAPCAVLVVR